MQKLSQGIRSLMKRQTRPPDYIINNEMGKELFKSLMRHRFNQANHTPIGIVDSLVIPVGVGNQQGGPSLTSPLRQRMNDFRRQQLRDEAGRETARTNNHNVRGIA